MAVSKGDFSVSETPVAITEVGVLNQANSKTAHTSVQALSIQYPIVKRTKNRMTGAEAFKRLRLSTYWIIIEVLLIIPMIVVLVINPREQTDDFSAFGVLLYIEIAWCSLLVSHVALLLVSFLYRQCIEALNLEDLDAYLDVVDHIKFSWTLLSTAIICFGVRYQLFQSDSDIVLKLTLLHSHTEVFCYRRSDTCADKWLSKLQHTLLATVIVCAAFAVKAVLVEAVIARTALRSLFTKQIRVNQVVDASVWILDKLTPNTSEELAEGYAALFQRWLTRFWVISRDRKTLNFLLFRHRPGENSFEWLDDPESGSELQNDSASDVTENERNRNKASNADRGEEEEDKEDDGDDEESEEWLSAYMSMHLDICIARGYTLDRTNRLLDEDDGGDTAMKVSEIRNLYKTEIWDDQRKVKSGRRLRALYPSSIVKLLDRDNDDLITKKECVNMLDEEITPIKIEIQRGLDGIQRAARDVDIILSIILLAAAALIYAAFFVDNFTAYTTPIWTAFTGLGFALGGTITEFLASCFFVFCKQPYDVGDRVRIDEKDLIVDEVHLNYTIFKQIEDFTVLQICHSQLLGMWIANKTRTKTQESTDTIKLPARCDCSDSDNVQEKIDEVLLESGDCRQHLEKEDGAILKGINKNADGSWELKILFKYREKLVYRETDLAECRETFKAALEDNLKKNVSVK